MARRPGQLGQSISQGAESGCAEPRRPDRRPTPVVLLRRCVIVGVVALIVGGCGSDGSTASPDATTPVTSPATTVVAPASSTAPSDPGTTTTAAAVTVSLGNSVGPDAVSEALEAARVLWTDADVSSYRLTIAENRNYWSAGCKWNIVVTDREVTANAVDPASTSTSCTPLEWTVEELHDMVAYWLASIREFAAPEFGEHTIEVQFDDIGVPVALEYDLANGADEESSMQVTFTADA